MKRDYLPIEVETIEKENFWDIISTEIKRKIWYMDICKLTISELIEINTNAIPLTLDCGLSE